MKQNWIVDFKKNVHSQTGEDGIIEKILSIIPEKNNWCVEFGAWDGVHLSNTRYFIENYKYSAVLIEGSTEKYKELKENYSSNKNVYPINTYITLSKENNLDVVLSSTPIPINFDFISIDIDGCDYYVWKSIEKYKPKLVCIEFNPTIPTEVEYIQEPNFNVNFGNSLLAYYNLSKNIGYELVCVTEWNAFFVVKEYYNLFKISDNAPYLMRTNLEHITYFFHGFNGSIKLSGYKKILWHDIEVTDKDIQVIPRTLRKFPDNFGKIKKLLLKFYSIYKYLKNKHF
jgi:hypothetical protein